MRRPIDPLWEYRQVLSEKTFKISNRKPKGTLWEDPQLPYEKNFRETSEKPPITSMENPLIFYENFFWPELWWEQLLAFYTIMSLWRDLLILWENTFRSCQRKHVGHLWEGGEEESWDFSEDTFLVLYENNHLSSLKIKIWPFLKTYSGF